MTRGVSQLLFNYLPGRTVDWEDGLAIVQLGRAHLGDVWTPARSAVVLDEVAQLIDRWRARGGMIDPEFPDPGRSRGRFVVGTPTAIEAFVLQTAYVCQNCRTITFPRPADLSRENRGPLRCPECHMVALRQFGQVFVHGCGELVPLTEYIPGAHDTDGILEPFRRRIRCPDCGDNAILEITADSERVSDMKIICRNCRREIVDRMTARCPRCTIRVRDEQRRGEFTGDVSPVTRIAMRMTRYSANDTYYPHSVTLLRLDKPALVRVMDSERELQELLPVELRAQDPASPALEIGQLSRQLQEAEARGDSLEKERILSQLAQVIEVAAGRAPEPAVPSEPPSEEVAEDVLKGIRESLAFRTTVRVRPALELAQQSSVGQLWAGQAVSLQRSLGLREIALVDNLPVITATFGYTRRSFEPTYDELGATLPTELRVFPSLDQFAANKLGRQDLVGTIPILAREGEHQGLFVSLDPSRVVDWLDTNGVTLPQGSLAITRILTALEPIDRYYDDIWECTVRRLVFGLIHTLSHAVMRATSRFAGLERTSLSEYIFLPLLGTVVFDTSGAFQLGGIETMVRDHLTAFLEQLSSDALECLYDTDCIDGRGACHGCVYSPEISCRVFNHGLSRSFLLGGHTPWADVSDDQQLHGYWQEKPW